MTKEAETLLAYKQATGHNMKISGHPEELAYYHGIEELLEEMIQEAGLEQSGEEIPREEVLAASQKMRDTWETVHEKAGIFRGNGTICRK